VSRRINTVSNVEVVIIGAGISGLSAARLLQQRGVQALVLEKSDTLGGRIRSDQHEGFILDRGFQVLLTAYPEAEHQLDYERLDLKPFLPGALIWNGNDFNRIVDPMRDVVGGMRTIFEPVGTLADKARIGKLRRDVTRGALADVMSRPETWTFSALRSRGFSGDIIRQFFRPFLAGVFLESELETSSRFFEFVFRMFVQGDAALPARGMQAIPEQLAASLQPETVRFRAPVESIERGKVRLVDGEVISTETILVAAEGPEAARLLGWRAPAPARAVTTIYYSSPEPPVHDPMLILNGTGRGLVNNVCVPNQVAPEYAPPGRSLVSVSLVGLPEADGSLEDAVKQELQVWFGPLAKHFGHLRTYRIPYALPDQASGTLDPVEKPVVAAPGIFVCGDHRDTASINGALSSARRAAHAILTTPPD
jgi:phytoene dehydrogenase-like protein